MAFEPAGLQGYVTRGINLVEASRLLKADIEALCGENRVCGKCKVRIKQGQVQGTGLLSSRDHVTPWEKEEARFITQAEKAEGFRLACTARLLDDVAVFVPEESRAAKAVVSKAAGEIHTDWDPAVRLYSVTLALPALEKPLCDMERLAAALETQHGLRNLDIDLAALRELPSAILKEDDTLTAAVWMDREIIRSLPGRIRDVYGLAMDIGTTTCALYLCNLRTMEVVETAAMMNPQSRYGEDVMSRITFHMQHADGLDRMRTDLLHGLNRLVEEACAETISPGEILDITIGCNTVMHHIFLGLDPSSLGRSPFNPVATRGLDLKARDLGLNVHPGAGVFMMPNRAGFIGADCVCAALAAGLHQGDDIELLVDIGTNGEIVLGNRKRLVAASCATGPAFEGGGISCGMRAAPGAIERIRINPETRVVDYKVVGRDAWLSFSRAEDMQVRGICGSGILDLLAELFLAGVIDSSGRFSKEIRPNRSPADQGQDMRNTFIIARAEETALGRDIMITQKDIRQIQLGKGALYAGCRLLMRHLGVSRVDRVKIAGAFGTHIDRKKALLMGLIPDIDPDLIKPIGNAAGDGARMVLLNRRKRAEALALAQKIEYLELTAEADFQEAFLAALAIPHQYDPFPHSEKLLSKYKINS